MKSAHLLAATLMIAACGAAAQSQTGEMYASSELSITDFTLTTPDGVLQPIGLATLDGYNFIDSSEGIPQGTNPVCVGACGTNRNFVSASYAVSSVAPLTNAGASFQMSAQADVTRSNPFLIGSLSQSMVGVEQQFTLSQSSQLTVNFLASLDLQAKITNAVGFNPNADSPEVRFDVAIVKFVTGYSPTNEMLWFAGPYSYGQTVNTTVVSQPFFLDEYTIANCPAGQFCPNQDDIYENSGVFTANTTSALAPGTYTLFIGASTWQSSGPILPEPDTLLLFMYGLLGLTGVSFMSPTRTELSHRAVAIRSAAATSSEA